MTRRLVHLAYLGGLKVLEHLIIGQNGEYFSFRNNGLIMIYEQEIRETYRLQPRPSGGLLHEIEPTLYVPKKAKARRKADLPGQSFLGPGSEAAEPALVSEKSSGWGEGDQ